MVVHEHNSNWCTNVTRDSATMLSATATIMNAMNKDGMVFYLSIVAMGAPNVYGTAVTRTTKNSLN